MSENTNLLSAWAYHNKYKPDFKISYFTFIRKVNNGEMGTQKMASGQTYIIDNEVNLEKAKAFVKQKVGKKVGQKQAKKAVFENS
jgi:hypothetical protein